MRFPFILQRRKGGVVPPPLLGGDTAPSGEPNSSKDNQFSVRTRDILGWPAQRLIVGAKASSAGATMPTMDVYFFEEQSQGWFKLTKTPVTLLQDEIVAVDLFAILEPAPTNRTLNDSGIPSNAGGIDLCIVLTDPGAATAAAYTIVAGADTGQLAV